jgi:hypothetical protein
LEFLQNYITDVKSKVNSVFQRDKRQQYNTIGEETQISRLKNFVMQRISSILQREGLMIDLKTIMERLKLEFMQVRQICKFKLDGLNDNRKLLVGNNRILQSDLYCNLKENMTG